MKKTMGEVIAENRKAKGMTQLQLARKMGVTDKAVSKWERDLSCPDISSLPQLSAVLEISVEELMLGKPAKSAPAGGKLQEYIDLTCKAVGPAMGVAVAVLAALDRLDARSGMVMLGISLACLAVTLLEQKKER